VCVDQAFACASHKHCRAAAQAEAAGTYAAEYLVNADGSYSLRGSMSGTLLDTVYTVTIAAGQIRVDKCLAAVSGWAPGQNLTAGASVSFAITAKDKGALRIVLAGQDLLRRVAGKCAHIGGVPAGRH
jgi:hypothetical protein